MWKWSNCFNVFKGSPLVRTETESKCPNLSHWHFTFPNISNISMPFVCVHTKRWAIVHADSQALALINGKVTVKCYYLHLFSWFHGSHLWKRFGFFLLFFFHFIHVPLIASLPLCIYNKHNLFILLLCQALGEFLDKPMSSQLSCMVWFYWYCFFKNLFLDILSFL